VKRAPRLRAARARRARAPRARAARARTTRARGATHHLFAAACTSRGRRCVRARSHARAQCAEPRAWSDSNTYFLTFSSKIFLTPHAPAHPALLPAPLRSVPNTPLKLFYLIFSGEHDAHGCGALCFVLIVVLILVLFVIICRRRPAAGGRARRAGGGAPGPPRPRRWGRLPSPLALAAHKHEPASRRQQAGVRGSQRGFPSHSRLVSFVLAAVVASALISPVYGDASRCPSAALRAS